MLRTHGPGLAVDPPSVQTSLDYVRGLARSHYENFHVLTSLVPADLRDDFAAVYAFCRWADDLGDETGNSAESRARSLELLAWWRESLQNCFACVHREGDKSQSTSSPPTHPVFVALAETIRRRPLSIAPFDNLIRAFELDQTRRHYETWDDLIHYCTLSANPVGRIVLALANYSDSPEHAERYAMSDAICTALQLTNHWQDVRRDLLERDRVYIPSKDTGVTPDQLREWAARPNDSSVRVPYIKLLRPLVERTWPLFEQGASLPSQLDKRIRSVVWLFAAGGRSILTSVERRGCTTLWKRPTLTGIQKGTLLARAWFASR